MGFAMNGVLNLEKIAAYVHMSLVGTNFSLFHALATFVAIVALLGTAGCIGVTGKQVVAGSGTGAATPEISITPGSVSFGNVNVGTTVSQSMLVANNGTADLTISQVSMGGTPFTLANISNATTVAAGQSATFTASFKPTTAGNATGTISIVSNAPDSPTTVDLTGTGETTNQGAPSISVSPTSANFGNVIVGNTDSQLLTVSNTGTANLTVSSLIPSGSGFSASGLSVPFTLTPGQNANFTVAFGPRAAGSQSGSVSLANNAASSPLVVSLNGTGIAATYQLTASSTNLSFGNVTVGKSATQNISLTNTGNSNVSVSTIAASGTGFTESGGSNLTLTPNQSTNISVTFNPSGTGNASGTVSVTSNAQISPLAIPLSGIGVQSAPPSVALNWKSSTSQVVGYFVYRKIPSDTQYSKLNSSVVPTTSYTDATVSNSQTYDYAVTSVDSSNIESAFSNQVTVNIP